MLSIAVHLAIEQASKNFLLNAAKTEIHSIDTVMSIALTPEGTDIHLTGA
jgi:hypothetical protein